MRDQIKRHLRDEELNPFKRYNPTRPIMEWYNGYKMDRYISAVLDKRYEEWKTSKSHNSQAKSVIDLALVII